GSVRRRLGGRRPLLAFRLGPQITEPRGQQISGRGAYVRVQPFLRRSHQPCWIDPCRLVRPVKPFGGEQVPEVLIGPSLPRLHRRIQPRVAPPPTVAVGNPLEQGRPGAGGSPRPRERRAETLSDRYNEV